MGWFIMNEIRNYLKRIYKARFFLIHLVKWDIKYKFRRSFLGIVWTAVQPLMLTIIIGAVFGFVLKQPMKTYAPYILSGVLVWDIITAAVITNSSSFLQGESYIRQIAHPVAIYPLRAALVCISTFFIANSGLLIWILFLYPEHILFVLMALPLVTFIYFLYAWSISIISSHIHIRYRDYPYIMALVMQALWYFSPVFFEEKMFASNAILHKLFLINPITHVLFLIRKPYLEGKFADISSYLYVIGLAILLLTIAWFVNKKCEKKVIYYF
jgi:lipopolysaccharide transport system permease protein